MHQLGGRSDSVQLRSVRLRGAADRLLARQRFEAALSDVTPSTVGLPPQALLVVRRVAPAEPLQLGSAGSAKRFGNVVRADLEGIARRARRQWLDADAAASDAVLFADEAELVACLVRDWLRGRVADRWWWRSVLGDLSPQQWLRQHVLSRGDVMVPAIAVLTEGPDAAAWLARLDDSEAEQAMAVIARTHAVSLTVEQDESTGRPPSVRSNYRGLVGIEVEADADSRSPALERLIATVPEVLTPTLRPPQRRLVALALALTRAPSWARTPQLAFALQTLDRAGPVTDAQAPANLATGPSQISKPREPRTATETETPSTGDMPEQRGGALETTDSVGASTSAPEESLAVAQEPASTTHVETRYAPQVAQQDVAPDAPLVVTRTVVSETPATQTETPPALLSAKIDLQQTPSIEGAVRVRTQFGGIFYLLNTALALKLYADFSSPRGANLKISPWDWLALVGRAWFGRDFIRDPVWNLLAGLAGRERRSLRRPRWLKTQIEQLRARLALALGEAMSADIPALVCRYPAEIEATVSRVDVHLVLSALPLAIRVAGLDRDPGWIPAAGRTIAFHFE
jgi:hypothetical protein